MEDGQTVILTAAIQPGWHSLIAFGLASTPLAALSIILLRAGRRIGWIVSLWLVAAVAAAAAVVWAEPIPEIPTGGTTALVMTLLTGWTNGAYAATTIMLVCLAALGFRAGPADSGHGSNPPS